MVDVRHFFNLLKSKGSNFFVGVPDSLLKNFCSFLEDNCQDNEHIIAANEGNAFGLAMGMQMASNKIPIVYLQNSGLGNIVNPLVSLADKKIQ